MPPESNGLAKGHDKPPSQQGPKDKPLSAVQPVETVVAETIPPGQATAPGQAKR
jgi:hypothetical protein